MENLLYINNTIIMSASKISTWIVYLSYLAVCDWWPDALKSYKYMMPL